MKANEARVGNIVMNKDGHVKVITAIMGDECFELADDINDQLVAVGDCNPIPIHAPHLLRLGFDSRTCISYECGHPEKYLVWKKELFTYNSFQSLWWYNVMRLPVQPEYVHQLQNLYYALAGNDINFK